MAWGGAGTPLFKKILHAEDEDAIFDQLEKVGFNELMNTLPNEMPIYMAHDKLTDKTVKEMAEEN